MRKMPQPKDPNKIDEWKRKIGLSELQSKKDFSIQNPEIKIETLKKGKKKSEFNDKELIGYHAKLHAAYRLLKKEEFIEYHNIILYELLNRNFSHNKYDELDKKTDEFLMKHEVCCCGNHINHKRKEFILKNIDNYDITSLNDAELMEDHRLIHLLSNDNKTKDKSIEMHNKIKEEFSKRGLKHTSEI
jgi:hypothetical protein